MAVSAFVDLFNTMLKQGFCYLLSGGCGIRSKMEMIVAKKRGQDKSGQIEYFVSGCFIGWTFKV
jgi:hypothetical protein